MRRRPDLRPRRWSAQGLLDGERHARCRLGRGGVQLREGLEEGGDAHGYRLKYTQNECAIFGKRFTELGGEIVGSYNYKQGDTIPETVSKIANGPKADVIINCAYSPGGVEPAKELRAAGIETPIISGFDGRRLLDRCRAGPEGLLRRRLRGTARR